MWSIQFPSVSPVQSRKIDEIQLTLSLNHLTLSLSKYISQVQYSKIKSYFTEFFLSTPTSDSFPRLYIVIDRFYKDQAILFIKERFPLKAGPLQADFTAFQKPIYLNIAVQSKNLHDINLFCSQYILLREITQK